MNTLFTAFALSLVLGLGSARVIMMQSLAPNMSLRQAAPFRSFSEFNRRRRVPRPIAQQCITTPYRTLSGFCNNRRAPKQGSADTPFRFIARPVTLNFARLPNARTISNIVCEEAAPIKNARGMSELVTFFGQLLDHTVTETANDPSRPLPISVPAGDISFKTTQFIPFERSSLEGEAAYNEERAPEDARRASADSGDGSFISGDDRVNENPNLTAMHLLFTREHNEVAKVVAREFPGMNDEDIYQLARHVVIAEFQAIVFHEFLPALFGRKLPAYSGYKEGTVAAISNSFSTVAFRVGHTLLNSTVTSISASGAVNNRRLRDSFFNPDAFRSDTIEGLLRGMMSGFASEVDAGITGEVRNFLVNETSRMQLDLAALNIQRGRDHGVPRYNALRTF
eukprot:IDg14547t1